MQAITEGKSLIYVPKTKKISKDMPVFYNPVMKYNRDVSIEIIREYIPKRIADPFAGTGIRSIRVCLESGYKPEIIANDYDSVALRLMKKNFKLNRVKIKSYNMDANEFLLSQNGFDYIDIDPFGSPNPFLDCAIKRLSRDGILAVTATDTAPLCGTYPKTCQRKYWATPLRNHEMHEIGLRILIRKIQLIGSQYDRALTPILSYSKDHYFRTFLRSQKGKQKVDQILIQHGRYKESGPMWLGQLWEKPPELDIVGFHDIARLAKKIKLKSIPKIDLILNEIRKTSPASRTHFSPYGIKTTLDEKSLIKKLQKL